MKEWAFNQYIPLDSNIIFHKIVACTALFFSVLHSVGHWPIRNLHSNYWPITGGASLQLLPRVHPASGAPPLPQPRVQIQQRQESGCGILALPDTHRWILERKSCSNVFILDCQESLEWLSGSQCRPSSSLLTPWSGPRLTTSSGRFTSSTCSSTFSAWFTVMILTNKKCPF